MFKACIKPDTGWTSHLVSPSQSHYHHLAITISPSYVIELWPPRQYGIYIRRWAMAGCIRRAHEDDWLTAVTWDKARKNWYCDPENIQLEQEFKHVIALTADATKLKKKSRIKLILFFGKYICDLLLNNGRGLAWLNHSYKHGMGTCSSKPTTRNNKSPENE